MSVDAILRIVQGFQIAVLIAIRYRGFGQIVDFSRRSWIAVWCIVLWRAGSSIAIFPIVVFQNCRSNRDPIADLKKYGESFFADKLSKKRWIVRDRDRTRVRRVTIQLNYRYTISSTCHSGNLQTFKYILLNYSSASLYLTMIWVSS